jgi:hypothetical protein
MAEKVQRMQLSMQLAIIRECEIPRLDKTLSYVQAAVEALCKAAKP